MEPYTSLLEGGLLQCERNLELLADLNYSSAYNHNLQLDWDYTWRPNSAFHLSLAYALKVPDSTSLWQEMFTSLGCQEANTACSSPAAVVRLYTMISLGFIEHV